MTTAKKAPAKGPSKAAKAPQGLQAPMSNTERVQAFRERLASLGIKTLEVYCHPDDKAKVRAYVARLNKARGL